MTMTDDMNFEPNSNAQTESIHSQTSGTEPNRTELIQTN